MTNWDQTSKTNYINKIIQQKNRLQIWKIIYKKKKWSKRPNLIKRKKGRKKGKKRKKRKRAVTIKGLSGSNGENDTTQDWPWHGKTLTSWIGTIFLEDNLTLCINLTVSMSLTQSSTCGNLSSRNSHPSLQRGTHKGAYSTIISNRGILVSHKKMS